MKTRHKRLAVIVAGLVALGIAASLVLNAFQSNLVFFYTPTQILKGEAPKSGVFRVGGLVEQGSLKKDGLKAQFIVTDLQNKIAVRYEGILPDLFREGQGVVAQGKLQDAGMFIASQVLAKHDEKYTPREVQDALKQPGGPTPVTTIKQ